MHGRRNRSGRPGGCKTNNLTNKGGEGKDGNEGTTTIEVERRGRG